MSEVFIVLTPIVIDLWVLFLFSNSSTLKIFFLLSLPVSTSPFEDTFFVSVLLIYRSMIIREIMDIKHSAISPMKILFEAFTDSISVVGSIYIRE